MLTAHAHAHTHTRKQMEGYIVPSLIWLCYAGQRAMRAAAIWEGVLFLDEHPEFARARYLQVVMIALEAHGAWRCWKHLPSLGDTTASSKAAKRRRGGGSQKAAAAVPAATAAVAAAAAAAAAVPAAASGSGSRNNSA